MKIITDYMKELLFHQEKSMNKVNDTFFYLRGNKEYKLKYGTWKTQFYIPKNCEFFNPSGLSLHWLNLEG